MATNSNSKKYVVGIGEALLDVFSDGTRRLGGAPLIFAYHAGKTFGKGVIVSAVGDDAAGENIKQDLNTLGVEDKYLYMTGKPTGTVKVNDTDPNDPKYNIDTDSAWTEIPYDEQLKELADNTAAVYFGPLASYCGQISKTTIDKFLKELQKDCWKIFDVNLRHNPVENNKYTDPLFSEGLVREYIDMCNVLKVNKEEMDYLCTICGIMGNLSNKKKSEALMDRFTHIKILLLTLGEEGSAVFWRTEGEQKTVLYQYYGVSVEQPLNSVGAGDALAGAFIGEILKENKEDLSQINIGKAHVEAVRRSAQVCSEGNSMPPILHSDIFVSYSRKDEDVVVNFCRLFNAQNWSVWRDKEQIEYGEEFPNEIRQAINNCKVVVYFSSEDSNKSEYVEKEIQYANNNGKKIVPIRLRESELNSNIESIVKWKNYLDWDMLCKTIKEGFNK